MVGNDYSMVLLSSSLKQPIYVFENGKMLQSYGKSQGGKPITIGYNPTNQQYFSFSNKGSNNSGSIYDAISGSTQGKYSSDFLQNIACPISTSSGTPKPPPPPPLPKVPIFPDTLNYLNNVLPINPPQQNMLSIKPKPPGGSSGGAAGGAAPGGSSGGAAAGGKPLYSFNAIGSGEIALPPEFFGKPPAPQITVPKDIPSSSLVVYNPGERAVGGIAPNMDDYNLLLAEQWFTKFASESTGLQRNWALNTIKAIKQVQTTRSEEPHSLSSYGEEVTRNRLTGKTGYLGEYVDALGNLIRWGTGSYVDRMAEGAPISTSIVKGGFNLAGQYIMESAIETFGEQKVQDFTNWFHEKLSFLTPGQQTFTLCFGPPAALNVLKAGGKIFIKGAATVAEGIGGSKPLLAIEGTASGIGEISAELGETSLAKPTIPLEIKPTTSSVVAKVEQKLSMSLVVGENIKPIIQLEAPQFIAEIKSFAEKHNWHNLPEIVESLPDGYNFTNYTKGGKTIGMEFAKGTHNKIALKKAKFDADYPSQQVDYVSYRVNGNMHVARNGDLIYESKGNIMRRDYITDQVSVIPVEELQRLGITNPKNFPEVHIPMGEFFNKIDEFIKRWKNKK